MAGTSRNSREAERARVTADKDPRRENHDCAAPRAVRSGPVQPLFAPAQQTWKDKMTAFRVETLQMS